MNNISTKINITVPFYDLDPMNVVWHGNYIKYLEMARCDFLEKINYTYMDMYKDNVMYPIVKLETKFVKSAYFGEKLEVKCSLVEIEPALIFKYEIKDIETKELICCAKTVQMGVDISTKETIYNINENFRKKLDEYKN